MVCVLRPQRITLPKATKKIVNKIRELAATGKIKLEDPRKIPAFISMMKRAKSGIAISDDDWSLTDVELECTWAKYRKKIKGKIFGNDGGFSITWSTKSCGFGNLVFYKKNGKLRCDNETMGKTFITKVLTKLVETTQLDS